MSSVNGFMDKVQEIFVLTPGKQNMRPDHQKIHDWLEKNYQYNKYLTLIEKAEVNYDSLDPHKAAIHAQLKPYFKEMLEKKIAMGKIQLLSSQYVANMKVDVYQVPNAVIRIEAPAKKSPGNLVTFVVDFVENGKKRKLVVVKDMHCRLVKENTFVMWRGKYVPDGRQLQVMDNTIVETKYKMGRML
ncbi:MAG: hypothetical protein ACYCQJ_13590 [Nitrososphaerales archaeon]